MLLCYAQHAKFGGAAMTNPLFDLALQTKASPLTTEAKGGIWATVQAKQPSDVTTETQPFEEVHDLFIRMLCFDASICVLICHKSRQTRQGLQAHQAWLMLNNRFMNQ